MNNFKKGISPVIATALFLVIAIVAVINFQTWFISFQSSTNSNVELKSDMPLINVEAIINDNLYLKSSKGFNLSYLQIKNISGDVICSFDSTPHNFSNSSLIGSYSFENYNSSHIFDDSGNNNHLELGPYTTIGAGIVPGIKNNGFNFDGRDDYLFLTNPTFAFKKDFTIEFWILKTGTQKAHTFYFNDGSALAGNIVNDMGSNKLYLNTSLGETLIYTGNVTGYKGAYWIYDDSRIQTNTSGLLTTRIEVWDMDLNQIKANYTLDSSCYADNSSYYSWQKAQCIPRTTEGIWAFFANENTNYQIRVYYLGQINMYYNKILSDVFHSSALSIDGQNINFPIQSNSFQIRSSGVSNYFYNNLLNYQDNAYIVGSFNYSSHLAKFYQDGILVNSKLIGGLLDTTLGSFVLGAEGKSGVEYLNSHFLGILDEVKLWNRSMSDSEVYDRYSAIIPAPTNSTISEIYIGANCNLNKGEIYDIFGFLDNNYKFSNKVLVK